MSKIADMLFGTHSQREIKRIEPLVRKIEELRPAMQELSDDQLEAVTGGSCWRCPDNCEDGEPVA